MSHSLHTLTVKQIISRVRQVFPDAPEAYIMSLINDGLVEAGSYIYVNVTPDGTTGGDNLINCNINAFEVPLLNVF